MKVLLVIIAVLAIIAGAIMLGMHFVLRDDKEAPSFIKSKMPGIIAAIVVLLFAVV